MFFLYPPLPSKIKGNKGSPNPKIIKHGAAKAAFNSIAKYFANKARKDAPFILSMMKDTNSASTYIP